MKNFKIITTSFFLASALAFASASVMAKTQGNNVNVNLTYNKSSHRYSSGNTISRNYPEFDNSKIGFGAAYKYSFNFNDIFISPGAFFDQIDTKAKDKDGDTVKINNRYGLRLDVGYDISDDLALYGFGGLANVKYKVDWASVGSKKSDRETSPLFGAGLIFYPSKDIALNIEYSHQSVDLNTPDNVGLNKTKTDISSIKIGFGYNF